MSSDKPKQARRGQQRPRRLDLPILLALGGLVLLGVAALALIRV